MEKQLSCFFAVGKTYAEKMIEERPFQVYGDFAFCSNLGQKVLDTGLGKSRTFNSEGVGHTMKDPIVYFFGPFLG